VPSSSSHSCQQGASIDGKFAYGEMIAHRNSMMEINSGSHECRSGSSTDKLDFNTDSHGHAKQHYDETLHAYAVDTSTQHVWDFAGQGYVHRLIQNSDGKIVEISDPTNTTSEERSLLPSLTDNEEGEIIHRKLERFASEYNSLLKDQLEQQRLYFESILMQIKRDHDLNASKTQSASTLISALKQDLHQLQQRYKTIQQKSAKVSENIAFLKNMNESLESNKEPMQKEIRSLQKGRTEYGKILHVNLSELEEKIQKLMLKLE
jgi:BRCA1-associated protein